MSEILYTTNGMNVFDNNAPGIIPKVLSNNSPINGIDASQYPKYDPDTGALKFIPENVFYGDYLRNESNRSDVRATPSIILFPKQENYLNNVEEILIMFQIVQIKKTTVDVLQIKSIHLHLELS